MPLYVPNSMRRVFLEHFPTPPATIEKLDRFRVCFLGPACGTAPGEENLQRAHVLPRHRHEPDPMVASERKKRQQRSCRHPRRGKNRRVCGGTGRPARRRAGGPRLAGREPGSGRRGERRARHPLGRGARRRCSPGRLGETGDSGWPRVLRQPPSEVRGAARLLRLYAFCEFSWCKSGIGMPAAVLSLRSCVLCRS